MKSADSLKKHSYHDEQKRQYGSDIETQTTRPDLERQALGKRWIHGSECEDRARGQSAHRLFFSGRFCRAGSGALQLEAWVEHEVPST